MKKKRPRTYQNRVARARNINMGKRGGEIRKVEVRIIFVEDNCLTSPPVPGKVCKKNC